MKQILLVEDSRTLGTMVQKRIQDAMQIPVKWVQTYEETTILFHQGETGFISALLDINLPDAPDGEIVDYIIAQKIPAIVFSSQFSTDFQAKIWPKGIVDYVLKDDPDNLTYIISLLHRLESNKTTRIILADDSSFSRELISNLLKIHNYIVMPAQDGKEALELLQQYPDTRLIITDYNMPRMDGYELIKAVRRTHTKNQLAIIGISAQGKHNISAKLLKSGANDFIIKPFSAEEFYCRVTQNIQNVAYIRMIQDISHKDYLTGLYNRRYFFEVATGQYTDAAGSGRPFSVAILDIDHFKKINDTFGHEAGDLVLQQISELLRSFFTDTDIISRFGGEEFCIFQTGADDVAAIDLFFDLKSKVEHTKFQIADDRIIQATVSIGVCSFPLNSLNEMILQADKMLYLAKENGRNMVEHYQDPDADSIRIDL